jgi:hypothetical protein
LRVIVGSWLGAKGVRHRLERIEPRLARWAFRDVYPQALHVLRAEAIAAEVGERPVADAERAP